MRKAPLLWFLSDGTAKLTNPYDGHRCAVTMKPVCVPLKSTTGKNNLCLARWLPFWEILMPDIKNENIIRSHTDKTDRCHMPSFVVCMIRRVHRPRSLAVWHKVVEARPLWLRWLSISTGTLVGCSMIFRSIFFSVALICCLLCVYPFWTAGAGSVCSSVCDFKISSLPYLLTLRFLLKTWKWKSLSR